MLIDADMEARAADLLERQFRYEAWKVRRGELRPKQVIEHPIPSDLAIITGVGWGKGEMAIRGLQDLIDNHNLMALLIGGPTFNLTMSNMVRGNPMAPGFMEIWPPHMTPTLHLGDEPFMICHTGCKIYIRTLQKPDQARGVNAQGLWIDEFDSARPERMTPEEALEVFDARARLPFDPEPFRWYSGTPKASRGGRLARKLSKRPGIRLVTGSSYENTNLPQSYHDKVLRPLEGTRRGQEEIYAKILDNVIGALVNQEEHIDPMRVWKLPDTIVRFVVGVDPAGTTDGDETGIVVVGVTGGEHPHGYVVADLSGHYTPAEWGDKTVDAALRWDALVVAEKNYGGEMVKSNVTQSANRKGTRVRVKLVWASQKKHVRAATVSPFYEHHEMHHLGNLPEYEAEMCAFTDSSWDGEGSPNRADAGVHALREVLPIRSGHFSMADLLTDEERAQMGVAA